MSDVTISDLIGSVEKYKFNPTMIQRTAIDALKIAMDSKLNIVDPTNPFIFCLEVTAANTAAFMQQNEATTRRLYPAASLTQEDLYIHMSDKDYLDRFAVPAKAKFSFMISMTELLSRLVLDPITGIKKVTIPKNTYITIANIDFSIQYAIDIRLMPSGGLQVVWISDEVSPLLNISSNIIEWSELTDNNNQSYINFAIDTHQFNVVTVYNDITAASGFTTNLTIEDQFYYIRVYVQNTDGSYREILTTHTQQIYDISKPTAVVEVNDKNVKVVIPIIYINSNQIRGKIRIDVYQTKGYINILLGNYNIDDFKTTWYNLDKNDDSEYTSVMNVFRSIAAYSTEHVIGGRDKLDLDTLRQRVILNAIGQHNVPITNIQLATTLEDDGYEIVRNVDIITNRNYLVTRNLQYPVDDRIITAASAAMVNTTFNVSSALEAHGVIDNTIYGSITLTTNVIYKNINGITKPISKLEYNSILLSSLAQKCVTINNNNYFYSPFHYCLDYSEKTLSVRPYYLDFPVINSKSFIQENTSTNLQVSVNNTYWIEKSDKGYSLYLPVLSSQSFKDLDNNQIHVQLAFIYKNNSQKSYLNAVLFATDETTNERIYKFDIESNFYIDSFHYLWLTTFRYDGSSSIAKCTLLQEFDILFSVSDYTSDVYVKSNIDDLLGEFLLPSKVIGITHEKIIIKFGSSLDNLWVRSSNYLEEIVYKKYESDIAALYESDYYEKDPVTGSIFQLDSNGDIKLDSDNNPVYNVTHKAGEVMYDQYNNIIYKHRAGDNILDLSGLPIPVDGFERNIKRSIDIFMIEAAYYYSDDAIVNTYKKLITSTLVKWITVDLPKYTSILLDQTNLYFYPKVTLGDVEVMALNGLVTTISASQSLNVILHVPASTYNNHALIESLNRLTIKTIDAGLKKELISISSIENDLMKIYGNDVVNVELSGIGGALNFKAITMMNKSNALSLKKKISVLADNKVAVTEDVNITYIKHDLDTLS